MRERSNQRSDLTEIKNLSSFTIKKNCIKDDENLGEGTNAPFSDFRIQNTVRNQQGFDVLHIVINASNLKKNSSS